MVLRLAWVPVVFGRFVNAKIDVLYYLCIVMEHCPAGDLGHRIALAHVRALIPRSAPPLSLVPG